MLAVTSECTHREHIEHMGRERKFDSVKSKIEDAVFFSIKI